MKLDKQGRRLCEYPYCRNFAENKGIRNGDRRYRPWCEKHRYVKIRAKRYAGKAGAKPALKSAAQRAIKRAVKPKPRGRRAAVRRS